MSKENKNANIPMFGIETGDGWRPIAQNFIETVGYYNNNLPDGSTIYINQIKEKFGELCIYVTYDNVPEGFVKIIEKLIKDAKDEASRTCEICGSKENIGMRTNCWYTTMCEKCAKEIVNTYNQYDTDYGKIGIQWKRKYDGKMFNITKEGIEVIYGEK